MVLQHRIRSSDSTKRPTKVKDGRGITYRVLNQGPNVERTKYQCFGHKGVSNFCSVLPSQDSSKILVQIQQCCL